MKRMANSRCEEHPDRFDCPDALIHFAKNTGKYGIINHDGGSFFIAISFCPWCGKSLKGDGLKNRRVKTAEENKKEIKVSPGKNGKDATGEHWRCCPRCGHELINEKCKLRCPRCHYFMSCSDFD
jgi:hypothetical protein